MLDLVHGLVGPGQHGVRRVPGPCLGDADAGAGVVDDDLAQFVASPRGVGGEERVAEEVTMPVVEGFEVVEIPTPILEC